MKSSDSLAYGNAFGTVYYAVLSSHPRTLQWIPLFLRYMYVFISVLAKKKIFATAFANISQVLEGISLLILLFFNDYSQETQGA